MKQQSIVPWETYEHLDAGIRDTVRIMHENGINTEESCDGSQYHSYNEPTVILEDNLSEEEVLEIVTLCYNKGLKPIRFYRPRHIHQNTGKVSYGNWLIEFNHEETGGGHYAKLYEAPSEQFPNGKIRKEWTTY